MSWRQEGATLIGDLSLTHLDNPGCMIFQVILSAGWFASSLPSKISPARSYVNPRRLSIQDTPDDRLANYANNKLQTTSGGAVRRVYSHFWQMTE
jgi:hypothetical protein